MVCKNCGTKIDKDTKICPNCGTNVTKEEPVQSSGNSIVGKICLELISVIFPIIGIVLFIVYSSKDKKISSTCLNYAMLGILFRILVNIF